MDGDLSLPPWTLAAGLGAVVAAAGSVLPWATLRFDPDVAELAGVPRTQTLGGLDGDGRITLALAVLVLVVLLAVAVRSRPGPKTAAATTLAGLLVVAAAAMDYRSLASFRTRIRQQAARTGSELAGSGGYALVRYWRHDGGQTAGD